MERDNRMTETNTEPNALIKERSYAEKKSRDLLWQRFTQDKDMENFDWIRESASTFLQNLSVNEADKATLKRSFSARIYHEEKRQFIDRMRQGDSAFGRIWDPIVEQLEITKSVAAGQLLNLDRQIKTCVASYKNESVGWIDPSERKEVRKESEEKLVSAMGAVLEKENFGLKNAREMADFASAMETQTTEEPLKKMQNEFWKKWEERELKRQQEHESTKAQKAETTKPEPTVLDVLKEKIREIKKEIKNWWKEPRTKIKTGFIMASLAVINYLNGGSADVNASEKLLKEEPGDNSPKSTETIDPHTQPETVPDVSAIQDVENIETNPFDFPRDEFKPKSDQATETKEVKETVKSWYEAFNINFSKRYKIIVNGVVKNIDPVPMVNPSDTEAVAKTIKEIGSDPEKDNLGSVIDKMFRDPDNKPEVGLTMNTTGSEGKQIFEIGHSGHESAEIEDAYQWPFDELRKAKEGDIITISQTDEKGMTTNIKLRVTWTSDIIPSAEFEANLNTITNVPEDNSNPIPVDLSVMGVPEEARNKDGITFAFCEKVEPGAEITSGKKMVTTEVIDIETEKTPPENVETGSLFHDVVEIQKLMNNYEDEYPAPVTAVGSETPARPDVGLGDYIKESEWYRSLDSDTQIRVEPILRTWNASTYSYQNSETGGWQEAQCLRFASLVAALRNDKVHNLNAMTITYPAEAIGVGGFEDYTWRQTEKINLNELGVGSFIITPKDYRGRSHVVAVVENKNGVVTIADVNGNNDGNLEIDTIDDPFVLETRLGPVVGVQETV